MKAHVLGAPEWGESGGAEGSLAVPKQEVGSDKTLLRNGQCWRVRLL